MANTRQEGCATEHMLRDFAICRIFPFGFVACETTYDLYHHHAHVDNYVDNNFVALMTI